VDAETLERSLQAALRQKRTGVPDRHFCTALGLEAKLDNMERELIGEALQRAGGVVGGRNGAARLLGVTRTGLLYKMRRLNVSRAAVDGLDGEESSDGERASGASAGAV
jgi:transcriptional regulator with GAF, ATPase, and Fis domain